MRCSRWQSCAVLVLPVLVCLPKAIAWSRSASEIERFKFLHIWLTGTCPYRERQQVRVLLPKREVN